MSDERDQGCLSCRISTLNGDNSTRLQTQVDGVDLGGIECEARIRESLKLIAQGIVCRAFVN